MVLMMCPLPHNFTVLCGRVVGNYRNELLVRFSPLLKCSPYASPLKYCNTILKIISNCNEHQLTNEG